MMFWKRPRYPYEVTMHLNGRHPYLKSKRLDYPTRDIVISVAARSFNDAEKIALRSKPENEPAWSWSVKAVRRLSSKVEV